MPSRAVPALYCPVPKSRKTHREIEIKLPVTDHRAAARAIQALGATSHGRVFETNTLYDTPQSDLRSRGRLLRVRIETPTSPKISHRQSSRVVLTAKAPQQSTIAPKAHPRYKVRAEREVQARHPHNWPAALKTLGLRPSFRYEKYRTSFRLGRLHMDLDETPVGVFLELEGPPSAIDRVARALGYQPSAYIRGTYWDVYAADCRRRGRKLANMVFPPK